MIRLIGKELRQLAPIAGLWVAVLVLGYSTQFFTERVDEETFLSWCEGYCDANASAAIAFFTVLIALVTAYSLFPREHDEGTIDFLRALPVSRAALYMAKVLAAWIVLCTLSALSYGFDALLLATNPESIGGRFYGQVWATLLWRDCLFSLIILSHGIVLSWFRTLGLVLYAIYLLILMWVESYLGTSGVWSIFSLLSNEYSGSHLLVNTRALIIHSAIAAVLLFIGYRLWNGTEASTLGLRSSRRLARYMQVVISVGVFLLFAVVLNYQVGVGTGSAAQQSLRVAETEHYRFVYKESNSPVVDYLLANAEGDYAELGRLLGIEELPRIRVDLSSSSEHAAGLAKWKKIEMDLNAFEEDVSQRRVLSHETTHVLQAVESNRAMSDNYSAAKFFIEGMAQYTSFLIVPEERRRRSNWELASVAWYRQKIEFSDLVNEREFGERFDAELHYSLGDLWTKALVDTCGERVLGDFIRAVGREDAPGGLPANLFWRDTTRAIGCDLDTVNVAWRDLMASVYRQVDQSEYPMYSDVIIQPETDTAQLKIVARLVPFIAQDATVSSIAGPEESPGGPALKSIASSEADGFDMPERFIVRIASLSNQLAAGVDPVFRGRLVERAGQQLVEFLVPEYAVQGTRLRYQLGFTPSPDSRYYYESWRRGTL